MSETLQRNPSPQGRNGQSKRVSRTRRETVAFFHLCDLDWKAWQERLESIPDPAYVRDASGSLILVNSAFLKTLGLPQEGWEGKTFEYWLSPESQAIWQRHLRDQHQSPVLMIEMQCHCQKGVRWYRWQEVRGDNEGQVHFFGFGRDCTREFRLESQSYLLSQAIEQCPLDIAIASQDGVMLYANQSLLHYLECTLEDLFVNRPLLPVFENMDPRSVRLLITQIVTGQIYRSEFSQSGEEGKQTHFAVQITGILDRDGKVTHLLMLRENVTDRKLLEDQVRSAQKMESIGVLAGGIAHDFNNLLGVINGYTDLSLRMPDCPEKVRKYLREVNKASTRAVDLVRQILTFSRRDEVVFTPVDVNQNITELVNMFRETFPRVIDFTLDLQPDLPRLLADNNQLQQVLINLCVNARDAMPNGGSLTLTTRLASRDELIRRGVLNDKDYVEITVGDTGAGIPPEVLHRIFEPFYTTKEKGRGTGLGLAVVDGIISRHHGYIDVISAVQVGTTFRIILPTAEQPSSVSGEAQSTVKSRFQGKRILIVDDEASLRMLLHSLLEENNYYVEEAVNGLEAIRRIENDKVRFDCVLLDYNMGGLNGLETFLRLRQLDPTMPFIVMSGFLTTEIRQCFINYGQKYFLNKPYNLSSMLQALGEVFAEQEQLVEKPIS